MKAAMLTNGVVTNIIVVDNESLKRLNARGYTVIASDLLGIEIGDYTEDSTIFYRDIPVYDEETHEQIGVEKTPLPIDPKPYAEYEEYYNAVSAALGGE